MRDEKDAREQWKLVLKYEAPTFMVGNSKEYLALGCLFRLRDHIAHRHARLLPMGTFPEKLDDCVRQGVVPVRRAEGADWTSVVLVHEVVLWAASTAKNWLDLAYELPPNRC